MKRKTQELARKPRKQGRSTAKKVFHIQEDTQDNELLASMKSQNQSMNQFGNFMNHSSQVSSPQGHKTMQ